MCAYFQAHFSAFDRRMADEGNCWVTLMHVLRTAGALNDNGNHIDVAMFQVDRWSKWGILTGPQVVMGVIRGAQDRRGQ